MKRIFGFLLALCMILTLCACGKSDAQVSNTDGTTADGMATDATTAGETTGSEAETTAAPAAQTTAAPAAKTTAAKTTAAKVNATAAKNRPAATTKATACTHTYKDGVCTRCGAKDPQYVSLATLMAKRGGFQTKLIFEKKLYSIGLVLWTRPHAYVGVAAPLSSLSEEMQKDENIRQQCINYNGVLYYNGKGNNSDLTVRVNGESVTVTDEDGASLTLAPDGGNLKCTAVSGTFGGCGGIKIGTVLTFAEPKG